MRYGMDVLVVIIVVINLDVNKIDEAIFSSILDGTRGGASFRLL